MAGWSCGDCYVLIRRVGVIRRRMGLVQNLDHLRYIAGPFFKVFLTELIVCSCKYSVATS